MNDHDNDHDNNESVDELSCGCTCEEHLHQLMEIAARELSRAAHGLDIPEARFVLIAFDPSQPSGTSVEKMNVATNMSAEGAMAALFQGMGRIRNSVAKESRGAVSTQVH